MINHEAELQKVSGIGPATARKLAEAGYSSIEAIARASPEELGEVVGDRSSAVIAAAREMIEEEKVSEVAEVEEIKKMPEEVITMAEVEKEQGPMLDLIDKVTDKETSLNINIEDVGGKLFGRSLRLLGKVNIDLGTLKKSK